MCFIVPFKGKLQTANKPITVYKVIDLGNLSLARNFQYAPNTVYRLGKPLKVNTAGHCLFIMQGFHSYNTFDEAASIPSIRLQGHYYKVVEFIIPKGAKYYTNCNSGESVSTSIRSGDLKELRVTPNLNIKVAFNV